MMHIPSSYSDFMLYCCGRSMTFQHMQIFQDGLQKEHMHVLYVVQNLQAFVCNIAENVVIGLTEGGYPENINIENGVVSSMAQWRAEDRRVKCPEMRLWTYFSSILMLNLERINFRITAHNNTSVCLSTNKYINNSIYNQIS